MLKNDYFEIMTQRVSTYHRITEEQCCLIPDQTSKDCQNRNSKIQIHKKHYLGKVTYIEFFLIHFYKLSSANQVEEIEAFPFHLNIS